MAAKAWTNKAGEAEAIAELRREIQIGIDEADQGELVDGEEVLVEREQLSAARRNLARLHLC